MDESQFLRLLGLFPMVRTRDYCADDAASSGPLVFSDLETPTPLSGNQQVLDSAGRETVEQKASTVGELEALNGSHDLSEGKNIALQTNGSHKVPVSFWELLQQEVGSKLGQSEAKRFCEAFRAQHNDLVNKTLSLDAIERVARNLALVHK
eukprot:TRINITY_DN3083_c0_g1_i2.p1 TRINITY_DN3083_c0_g1~~TRINITY_DN3083_c0_g1_i2.p1  ORF type:complete len:151 (+),score=23.86 TRINITY_DN3083_c0_g1_i2:126-578(+)